MGGEEKKGQVGLCQVNVFIKSIHDLFPNNKWGQSTVFANIRNNCDLPPVLQFCSGHLVVCHALHEYSADANQPSSFRFGQNESKTATTTVP